VEGVCFVLLLTLTGCGKPAFLGASTGDFPLVDKEKGERPEDVKNFMRLFDQHCRGCHGENGRNGAAPPLNDSLFLAIVPEEVLRDVITNGGKGTPMPAFARGRGGSLTTAQIDILVRGMHDPGTHNNWQKEGRPSDVPEYRLEEALKKGGKPGNVENGEMVYEMWCSSCHGPGGKGGDVGSLNDRSLLALISDQALRRIVITGRHDFGMPDYKTRQAPSFKPLTNQDVADVVALLASWRKASSSTDDETKRSAK
jgi:mono/diheme cytochrome c family protein